MVERRSADLAVHVGGRVEEGAEGTVHLLCIHEVLEVWLHLLARFGLHLVGGALLLGLGRRHWFLRELVAVEPEEGLGRLEVVANGELVLWLSCGLVGIGLVVPVLLLVLAGHDSDGSGSVHVLLVEVDDHELVCIGVVVDLQAVQVVLLPPRALYVQLLRHDFRDRLQRLLLVGLGFGRLFWLFGRVG